MYIHVDKNCLKYDITCIGLCPWVYVVRLRSFLTNSSMLFTSMLADPAGRTLPLGSHFFQMKFLFTPKLFFLHHFTKVNPTSPKTASNPVIVPLHRRGLELVLCNCHSIYLIRFLRYGM